MKAAQAVVKALAASRSTAADTKAGTDLCTVVNTISIKLTALVINFPSSPDVLVFSATIIASSSVVCTAAEKLSLAKLDAMFDEAVAELDSALEAAQEELEFLTGSTASAAVIAEVVATTTVAGAGNATTSTASCTVFFYFLLL